jgi:hypothetical protein
MIYSSTDTWVQIFAGLIAILAIALLVMFVVLTIPDLRMALLHIFGLEDEWESLQPKSNSQIKKGSINLRSNRTSSTYKWLYGLER